MPSSWSDETRRRIALWCALAAAALAVGTYYLWQLRAPGYPLDFTHDQNGYYNYLGRAFAHGHLELPIQPMKELLALPNPWDPAAGEEYKMHDMVLYHGRYYLYHGPGPAVLLFAPWLLLTGHDLPERFAVFLLCYGGFLFCCGVLMRLVAMAGVRLRPAMLALMVLALGLCTSVPYLLNRVWVYEIAIAGGYFCTSAAFYFLTRALAPGKCAWWLGASGVCFGLAIACRPHLGLAGLIVFAGLVLLLRRPRSEAIAFASAFALVGVCVALYNSLRFGSPLEFGLQYLLAGPDQNRVRLMAANIPPGLYFWLLCPPDFSAVFPWVRLAYRFPFGGVVFPFPQGYFIEATVGSVFLAPFVPASWVLPPLRDSRPVRSFLWMLAAFAVSVLLFLAATGFTTQRYEVDFLPAAVLAALAAFAIATNGGKKLLGMLAVTIVCGIVVNLALGILGPYGDMVKRRPESYVRLARWFSPSQESRPVLNPHVTVTFTAEFRRQPDRFRDPLVLLGGRAYRYFLFAEHVGGKLRMVSVADGAVVQQDIEGADDQRAEIRVQYDPASGRLATSINGREVAVHELGTLVMAPSQILLGENNVDPGMSAPRFTGQLSGVQKQVR
jgi:hypothetical protein